MRANLNDEVLMGMGTESVRLEGGTFEVVTPGARVTLRPAGELSVTQRIGADREVSACQLLEHVAPRRLSLWTLFRCVLEGSGLALTVQGGSVLILAPQAVGSTWLHWREVLWRVQENGSTR